MSKRKREQGLNEAEARSARANLRQGRDALKKRKKARGLTPAEARASRRNLQQGRLKAEARRKAEGLNANELSARRKSIAYARMCQKRQRENPLWRKLNIEHKPVDARTLRLALHRMWSELAADYR